MNELIPSALEGERIDRVVALIAEVSRSVAVSAIDDGKVLLDGEVVASKSLRVAAGQTLAVSGDVEPVAVEVSADATVEVDVAHVDEHVIIVDKRPGQVVHPGAGNDRDTIVQGLMVRYPEIATVGEPERPGVVHRLDKGTSGLFAVARTELAHRSLTDQLRGRSVERRYLALCWGIPDATEGIIDAPIGRAVRDPTRMTIRDDGKEARTAYSVDAGFVSDGVALLSCRLETGRTHQIRVHLQAIGHPVVGDGRYGGERAGAGIDRPALHAAELGFDHPESGERRRFRSEMPSDMADLITGFGPPTSGRVLPSRDAT